MPGKRFHLLCIATAALFAGCATSFVSSDAQANYDHVFHGMRAPMPEIIHSRVERVEGGITSTAHNGLWEFELVASPEWVREVKKDFVSAPWPADNGTRSLPAWFSPKEKLFEAFVMKGGGSYTAAHLYVERHPADPRAIRVFICRF